MLLPQKFQFIIKYTYDGKELDSLNENQKKEILNVDPDFYLREKCRKEIEKKLINKFNYVYSKYSVLKEVLNYPNIHPKNSLLWGIMVAALHQNITDVYELMSVFIEYIDLCKGKYVKLFDKNAQYLLVEVLKNKSEAKAKYQSACNKIDDKRKRLFIDFSQRGRVRSESFDILKKRVEDIRLPIKECRDKVTVHWENEECELDWLDYGLALSQFQEILYDFYNVLFFHRGEFGPALFDGISHQKKSIDALKELLWDK